MLSAPFAIYINDRYIPYKFERELRMYHFQEEVKQFLVNKYDWGFRTFQSINWQSHKNIIRDNRYTQKRFIKRFIHHRLPVDKMNFSTESRCPYYDKEQDMNTEHDHFLQCNSHREEKTKWIDKLRAALSKNFTPLNLREATLERVYNYYELNLRDSNKIGNFEMDYIYDSHSDSVEMVPTKRDQRRIIDQDSAKNTDDEFSLSSHSNESQLLHSRRRLIQRKNV